MPFFHSVFHRREQIPWDQKKSNILQKMIENWNHWNRLLCSLLWKGLRHQIKLYKEIYYVFCTPLKKCQVRRSWVRIPALLTLKVNQHSRLIRWKFSSLAYRGKIYWFKGHRHLSQKINNAEFDINALIG